MLPIASDVAVRLTRTHTHSALPDAPVLPEAAPTAAARAPGRRRLALARALRRLADRVEPARARTTPG